MSGFRRLLPALLLLAGSAVAADLGGLAPGARLAAGSRVVTTWPGAGIGTEAELVLSLDGGLTFPLRLTEETEPDAHTLAFRVPNLPSRHAVVALRTGDEGREETIRATSAEFVIEGDPRAGAEPLVALDGELATREAAGGALGSPLPMGLDGPAPSVAALGDLPEAAEGAALLPAPLPPAPSGFLAVPAPARVSTRTGLRAAISLPKRE